MTRKECLQILNDKDHPIYKELHHVYYTNYNNAKKFFKPLIDDMKLERPGIDIVLHHLEWNDQQYEKWDTVVPLYNDEHLEIHRFNVSDETRKKISIGNKGKIISDEHRRKISEAKKGKVLSDETKRKISEGGKGIAKPRTDKHCKNLSKALKGREPTLGFSGRRHSNETKQKISESIKNSLKKNSLKKEI